MSFRIQFARGVCASTLLALVSLAFPLRLMAGTTELICNGGFESGSACWTFTGGAEATSYGGFARTGSAYLWLGGAVNLNDAAYQSVALPSNATAATLSFYYNINSLEGASTAYDTFTVTIRNMSGSILSTVATLSNRDQTLPGNPYYYQKTFNLLPHAGQTIRIHFAGINDSSDVTNFRVDDVSVVATTPELGSLRVTINPSAAVSAGAQWRRAGTSSWRSSGSTESSVPTGTHTVEFRDIDGWTKPSNQSVTVNVSPTTTTSGTYTQVQHYGSLRVDISPSGAVGAGAQWRRTGTSTWRNSGSTEPEVPVGTHYVEFNDISGWTKPSNQSVTVNVSPTATTSGTYTEVQQYGSLQVDISPSGAVSAGAQWRRAGTSTWHNSGSTESSVPTGTHTVEFRDIDGWTKPSNQSVTVNVGPTTTTSGTYTEVQQYGSLQVDISPSGAVSAGAQWRRAGTSTWHNSGSTESSVPTGTHTVEFRDIDGWTKPSNQSVTVNVSPTTTTSGTYTQVQQYGSLRVDISPSGAVGAGAQWRRTGTSTWRNSGSTEPEVPVGTHHVEFNDISGWNKPSNKSVTVSANEPTYTNGTYLSEPVVSPAITSIDPNPVTGSNSRQWITINGSGFQTGLEVYVTWSGSSQTLDDSQVEFISTSKVRMHITTLNVADNWTVEVINPDGRRSGASPFRVEAGATVPPLTTMQVAQHAYDAGFRGADLIHAVAVSWAESEFYPNAVNYNPPSASGLGNTDRGLWQINDYYWPQFSDNCVFDPRCCAEAAYHVFSFGGWCQWCAFGTSKYRNKLGDARNAAQALDRELPTQSGDRVQATGNHNIRSTAGGAQIASQIAGQKGVIVESWQVASLGTCTPCGGTPRDHIWWKIQWNDGQVGWSAEEFLKKIEFSSTASDPAFESSAYRDSNPYWQSGFAPRSVNPPVGSKLGESKGNCTWFTYGRLLELGYPASTIGCLVGNAFQWDDKACGCEYSLSPTPVVNSVAQTDNGGGGYGHVAIVKEIYDDGTILIEESSYCPPDTECDYQYNRRIASQFDFCWYILPLGYGSDTAACDFLDCTPGSGGGGELISDHPYEGIAQDDVDGCPEDPNKTDPGLCGCGEPEVDGCGADDLTPPGSPEPSSNSSDPEAPKEPDAAGQQAPPAPVGFCGAGLVQSMFLSLMGLALASLSGWHRR